MNKDPAFLFYSSDFLTGVADLTMEERGQYITLLCLQHQHGHLSEKTICLSLGYHSVTEIGDVIKKFKQDDDGLYYQHRLEEEIEKRQKYTDSRRLNGGKGGRPKGDTHIHMDNHMDSTCEPYGKPTNNHTENENVNEDDIVNEDKIEGEGGKTRRTIPYKAVVDLWNNIAKELKPVTHLSEGRKRAIRGRYAEGEIETIKQVFEKVRESDYLNGRTGNTWQATFDWVMKSENWVKVIDGNYDNKQQALNLPSMPEKKPFTYESRIEL